MWRIIESHRWDEQCAFLRLNRKRLDDALEAVYWALARDPESFPQIPETGLSFLSTWGFAGCPVMRIFFRIDWDEEYVELVTVEDVQDDPDDPIAEV